MPQHPLLKAVQTKRVRISTYMYVVKPIDICNTIFVATDHAGLSTKVSSEELVVDNTPPNVGRISSDMLMLSEWISGDRLSLLLLDFTDDESGLDYFMVHVGSAAYKTDILTETMFKSDIIELDFLNMPVLDGNIYYIGAKVNVILV